MDTAQRQIPVTVLTGYLGAGKTTLLNRILSENHGKKYAVVINEFGELGVDNDLVVDADEEVFEMNNGCICCTVRGDLIRIISALIKRKGKLDGIIIETTGLADPSPVAQTFFVDEDAKTRTRLDAIVTVVDARNLPAQLADSHEAQEQVAFADVILLNKTDLVSAKDLVEVERCIRALNPQARLHRTERAKLPIDQVLGQGGFDLTRILEVEPDFLSGEDDHEHDSDVTSVSFELDRPLDVRASTHGSAASWPSAARTCCGPRVSWISLTRISASRSRPCTCSLKATSSAPGALASRAVLSSSSSGGSSADRSCAEVSRVASRMTRRRSLHAATAIAALTRPGYAVPC